MKRTAAQISSITFRKRRERFIEQLGEKAAIIPAANLVTHHADCHYPFRQNSDFWYLTGFDEPDAVALFLPHRSFNERFVLFVLPKDPLMEVWTGFRMGTDGAIKELGADMAFPIEEFPDRLEELIKDAEGIAFRMGKSSFIESIVLRVLSKHHDEIQRSGSSPLPIEDPSPLLHQLRLTKDPLEINRLREAARISAEAHELARKFVRPGITEKRIQALMENYFLENGARGPAYGSIVASGQNACILHYTENNDILREGDLLLIDAGCSLNDYYNGDITRTYPISGKFSGEQKEIYEIVLAAQISAINSVKPGQTTDGIHSIALKVLVDGLIQIGLLKGSTESLIENSSYRHLYMHRTGHWLGLDVHDVGAYRLGDYPVELKEGMALTVEPGIYISDRLPVPKDQPDIDQRWKGIGIRIEDDVIVKEEGNEVISSVAKKTVSELEE